MCQRLGEGLDVSLPLGQDQAVAPTLYGLINVADDQLKASPIRDKVPVDLGHSSRGAGIGPAGVTVGRLMAHQSPVWTLNEILWHELA